MYTHTHTHIDREAYQEADTSTEESGKDADSLAIFRCLERERERRGAGWERGKEREGGREEGRERERETICVRDKAMQLILLHKFQETRATMTSPSRAHSRERGT